MWAALVFLEKVLVLYICIHYHYRSDRGRIDRSKRIQRALDTLYEASVYLHPIFRAPFVEEDAVIRNSFSSGKNSIRIEAEKFLQTIGIAAGSVMNSDKNTHWFKPDSPYAIVNRALDHPRSAAALATRIWRSLVAEGKDALTVDDIAEVLGPHRREEAEECFRAMDENKNGDLHLKEMALTVVEAGQVRNAVYRGVHDINHTINTFDWIAMAAIASIMAFFICKSAF